MLDVTVRGDDVGCNHGSSNPKTGESGEGQHLPALDATVGLCLPSGER